MLLLMFLDADANLVSTDWNEFLISLTALFDSIILKLNTGSDFGGWIN